MSNMDPAITAPSPISAAPGHCPVCMRTVAAWKPFVRKVGEKQWREEPGGRLCPHCNSFERTRHVMLFLEQRGILDRRPRFLHVAPEPGLQNRLRAALGDRYVTTDLASAGVDVTADLTALPLAGAAFDFIYCSNVLEHVPDDRKAMSELFRVLAPGGLAYVQVPAQGEVTQEDLSLTDPARRAELYGQADHVRLYGRDVRERLARAGFRVEEVVMPDRLNLAADQLARFNCARRELIHFCHKNGA